MLNRNSASEARRVFERLVPQEGTRHRILESIATVIREAHLEAPKSWEITLNERRVCVNVGQVALVLIERSRALLYYRRSAALNGLSGSRAVPYSKLAIDAPIRRLELDPKAPLRLPRAFGAAQAAAARAAAQQKSGTPWAFAHSPGVLEYLRQSGFGPLPDPTYAVRGKVLGDPPKRRKAAGFGSAENNKKVEKAAIAFVTTHFRKRGYQVTSVESDDGRGYDLVCTRSRDNVHVEVKGTQGATPHFFMTRAERRVSGTDTAFRLAVVTNVLSARPKLRLWTAREMERDFDFDATQFEAALADG